jgi:hypothetical protein
MSEQGWKLVPVEPTIEMKEAALIVRAGDGPTGDIWRAMLAAAPRPQPAQASAQVLEALRRLWPLIERSMKGYVFTADVAGQHAADMNTLRAAIAAAEAAQAMAIAALPELAAAAENLLHEVGFGRIIFDTPASERLRAALAAMRGEAG